MTCRCLNVFNPKNIFIKKLHRRDFEYTHINFFFKKKFLVQKNFSKCKLEKKIQNLRSSAWQIECR